MIRKSLDGRRIVSRIVIMAIMLGAVIVTAAIVRYVVTDRGYERLCNSNAKTRNEVTNVLRGFSSRAITNPNEMNPAFRKHMLPGRQYIRYTILGSSNGIDVVYDSDGRLVAYWPQYE